MRQIFGKPIRRETTETFYPHKMTVEQFCSEIESSIEAFKTNLQTLAPGQERFIEEWFETMGAWMEIEEER